MFTLCTTQSATYKHVTPTPNPLVLALTNAYPVAKHIVLVVAYIHIRTSQECTHARTHAHTQTQMQLSLHICMTVMTDCSAVNVIISSSSLPTVLPPVLVPRSPAGLAIDTSPSSSISPVCTPLAEEFSPLSSNPPSYGSSHTTMNGCVQASMLPGKGSSVCVRACVHACVVCVCTRVCFHVSTLNWVTQPTLACGTTSTYVRMCIQCSCARAYSI